MGINTILNKLKHNSKIIKISILINVYSRYRIRSNV